MAKLNRRNFIKISSAAVGGAAVAAGLTSDWYGLDKPADGYNPQTDGDKVVATFCELCFWKCGVLAHVKDGVVTKLQGNPEHPLSRGRLCPRGVGGTGLLYDPDRLKTPLIRVKDAERGEDVFKEATWDEALDLIAENFLAIKEKYGSEAFALFQHGYGASWFKHLFSAYGSPNIAAPSFAQCRGARAVGFELTYGTSVGSPERVDMENAEAVVLIGSHLGENMHNTQVQDFARAVGKGAKVVVVDPRYSIAAGKADEWMPIKPGTDIALLLAWMNVMITEELIDKKYVDLYTYGYEQLQAHVADKTPEWAYPITGLKPEQIRRTARMMAAAKPAVVVHPGRRAAWYGDDTQRSRCIAILSALLGSWGRKGGYLVPSAMSLPAYPYKPYGEKAAKADKPNAGAYPLASGALASGLCDATIPGSSIYDVKAWMVYGTNLPLTLPEPEKTKKALQELDFVVAIDVLPAEICGWADVVLPESTYLERCDDVHIPAYKEPYIAMRQEVVPPMFGSKPGWWIAKEIGKRIGLEEYFPWENSEEYLKNRLEAGGYDCETVRKTGVIKGEIVPATYEDGAVPEFNTNTGKIELYSTDLANYGFDPLPNFTAHAEPPQGYMRLLIGRAPAHTFARTTNNRLLGQIMSENEVWLATSKAKDMGLEHGDEVILINQAGVEEGPVKVKVTERIRRDCVYMVHGFGHTAKGLTFAKGRGASDSALMSKAAIDPIMGGTGFNVNFVTMRRA
jgi:thiosulfate reductase/polysulfide reductase chain A